MKALLLVAVGLLAGCGSVHQEDLDAWVGQPVSLLDIQPFFLTLPVVKTVTPDGIEIRNYVNGANTASCWGSGFGEADAYNQQYITYANFTQVQSCISQFSACNNIFYIKDGRVIEYVPTPSGRARCMTDDRVRPRHLGG